MKIRLQIFLFPLRVYFNKNNPFFKSTSKKLLLTTTNFIIFNTFLIWITVYISNILE